MLVPSGAAQYPQHPAVRGQGVLPPFWQGERGRVSPDKVPLGSRIFMNVWSLTQLNCCLLLTGALLFLLLHPLPQLLANVSQGFHFATEGLHYVVEAAALRFSAMTAKHITVERCGVCTWMLNEPQKGKKEEKESAYRSLRFCDCFIWLKSVGSGLFTGLWREGDKETGPWLHRRLTQGDTCAHLSVSNKPPQLSSDAMVQNTELEPFLIWPWKVGRGWKDLIYHLIVARPMHTLDCQLMGNTENINNNNQQKSPNPSLSSI